jgi:lipopolysaccharide export system permease protein
VADGRVSLGLALAGLHGGVFALALALLWWRDHASVTHWPVPGRRRAR